MVGVLVLRVAVMSPNPLPRNEMCGGCLVELLPAGQVLDRTFAATPPARLPAANPLSHPLHEILRIAGELHRDTLPLSGQDARGLDGTPKRPAIVRGRWY